MNQDKSLGWVQWSVTSVVLLPLGWMTRTLLFISVSVGNLTDYSFAMKREPSLTIIWGKSQ